MLDVKRDGCTWRKGCKQLTMLLVFFAGVKQSEWQSLCREVLMDLEHIEMRFAYLHRHSFL
jgi:hypothetical protein